MSADTEEHKRIVRRWVKEVFNEHNLDMVEELKVPDYIDWNPYPGQDAFLGGFKAVLVAFFEAFPDFRYDVEHEIAEGDLLVCLGTWSGTNRGSFMGIPPTGERMSARRVDLVRFSGDRMTERWGTGNELKMLRMMGMCPPRPTVDGEDAAGTARRFVEEIINHKNVGAVEPVVLGTGVVSTRGMLELFRLAGSGGDVPMAVEDLVVDDGTVTARVTYELGHPGDGPRAAGSAALTLRLESGQVAEASFHVDRN